jgi:predicted lipoprotein
MYSSVISPAINNLDAELAKLSTKSLNFTNGPSEITLEELKTAFSDTYLTFQHIKPLNFGPLDDYGVVTSMNTYPTDTSKIQTNISSGSYVLGSAANLNAIGLPAIDYLLYHTTNSEVIIEFSTNPYAQNRVTYLTELISKMKTELASAKTSWNNYNSTFIEADGNDIGGSTSILFNSFVKDIELIKNAKIGIPAGFQTSGQTLPTYCEAYFSGISIELALENLKALQNIFNGGSALGFDDYIKDVEDESVTNSLADNINSQFESCKSKLNVIGNPLSNMVDSNPTAVSDAWQEIKKMITYTKTDMSSILGLLITFQDNDGD